MCELTKHRSQPNRSMLSIVACIEALCIAVRVAISEYS